MARAAALPPTCATYFFFADKKEVSKKKRLFAFRPQAKGKKIAVLFAGYEPTQTPESVMLGYYNKRKPLS